MKKLICLAIIFMHFNLVNSQTTVHFALDKEIPNLNKQQVGLRGSLPPLSWDQSQVMTKTDSGYTITLSFDHPNEVLEFKFVLFNEDASPNWESTPNRTIRLLENTDTLTIHSFNKEQIIDISKLPLLTPDQLKEDIDLFKTMVLDVHPGTYRYQTKERIDHFITELEETCTKSLSHAEFYLALSKVTAAIQCDHTMVGLYNQSNLVNSIIHYQKNKLPFTFRWIDGKMVVLENASKSDRLERGTVIRSINGIPALEILQTLMPFVAADGATDGNRMQKLEVEGYDFRFNFFDVYYPLLYPNENEAIQLEVLLGEQVEQIMVECLTLEERYRVLTNRYPAFPKSRDDLWNFAMLSDTVAMLTINSFGAFGYKAMTLDYKAFLADVFEALEDKQVPDLIIDIRKNNGGADEMAIELFSYLVEKPKPINRIGRTRYKHFPDKLKTYVQTWSDNPWYYELKPDNKEPIDGYYNFKEKQKVLRSDKDLFTGNIYLLTSAANTSLAYYTASRFRLEKLGPLIGQETGGNQNDINGGTILFLRLPNSQIEIDFPIMGGFSLVAQPNQGVIPDIEVEYTVEDINKNNDLEMDKVISLIKSRNQN